MECKLNKKRVLIGGLAAGVWINICEMVTHHCILMDRYKWLAQQGISLAHPRLYFFPVYPIMMLIGGIILAWMYGATRDTLGPGAVTAMKVGFVAFLLAGVPSNYT